MTSTDSITFPSPHPYDIADWQRKQAKDREAIVSSVSKIDQYYNPSGDEKTEISSTEIFAAAFKDDMKQIIRADTDISEQFIMDSITSILEHDSVNNTTFANQWSEFATENIKSTAPQQDNEDNFSFNTFTF